MSILYIEYNMNWTLISMYSISISNYIQIDIYEYQINIYICLWDCSYRMWAWWAGPVIPPS